MSGGGSGHTPAVTIHQPGGVEVLTVGEIEIAPPAAGQVVVEVAAAGVNFIDVYQREGRYQMAMPFVPGLEGCGYVREVGPGVSDLLPGQRVAWGQSLGSYAGRVSLAAAATIPVPANLDDAVAAALPLQGMTAHYLTYSSYAIRPGDTVVVHAAAGGVGLLLTQLARRRGARVIATCSPDKAELARRAGADVVIRYDELAHEARRLTGGAGVDCVYDGVGAATFEASLAALRPRGVLVLFGAASGAVPPFDLMRLSAAGSLSVTRPTLAHFVATRAELLWRGNEVFGLAAAGHLSVHIGGQYPLADVGRAHSDLEARRSTGKLLLRP